MKGKHAAGLVQSTGDPGVITSKVGHVSGRGSELTVREIIYSFRITSSLGFHCSSQQHPRHKVTMKVKLNKI